MLIKQVHQKSVTFVTICHCFFNYSVKFQPNLWNRCHDVLIMSMKVDEIAILNIKCSNYCCIVTLSSRNDAINSMQYADLIEKSGTL